MDEMCRNMVLDGWSDYELVRHSVIEISQHLDINYEQAWVEFEAKFKEISVYLRLQLYKSNALWGEMDPIELHELLLEDIMEKDGNLAPPPYIFFSVHSDVPESAFINFIETFGYPNWLKE